MNLLLFQLIMSSHPSFQPSITINPPLYKQNNSYTNNTAPHYQQRHFYPVGMPYPARIRPSSSSNVRPTFHNQPPASTHQQLIMQQDKYIINQPNVKFQRVSQENTRHQNSDQARPNFSRQKDEGRKKDSVINSCPNSYTKRAVVQSLIFPTDKGPKEGKCYLQQKLQLYPKIPTFPKSNPKFQLLSQFSPANNIQINRYMQAKTDREMLGRKQHSLFPNSSIPNNLKYMRQSVGSIGNQTKATQAQHMSPPNLINRIFIQEKKQDKVHPQAKNIQSMRKNMTQANIRPMSSSPSEQSQANMHLFELFQLDLSEEKESDKKNDSGQLKKRNNFQFFKNIKKKKLNCVLQPQQKQFQLSDFQLMDKLGKGAFGDVFIAQQKATGFICVIKKLSKKKLIEHKLEQQLLRQIKIQSCLNHRHLTSLYGFFNDQEYIYIILQLLPDGSMMHVKKKRKMPENQVSTYIRQISLGLKYMHTQSVIHRDIKPQNIFLYQGYAKIGDFGCSIYTNTYRNTQIGSLAYISPEQLKQSTYNQKIDIWSLGVIAYELLLGTSPFQKDIIKIARKEMAPQLSEVKFPENAVLSDQAKDFLIGMLNTDPEKRFGIQEAVRHEFILKYIKQDESKIQKIMS